MSDWGTWLSHSESRAAPLWLSHDIPTGRHKPLHNTDYILLYFI